MKATREQVERHKAGVRRLNRFFGFNPDLGASTIQTGRGPARSAEWRARQRSRKAAA